MYDNAFLKKHEGLHITAEKANNFDPYVQICAIWCNNSLDEEKAYQRYISNVQYAKSLGYIFNQNICAHTFPHYILSVEDARLLNGDISRLDRLYSDGVKVLTLCWKDTSCIGGAWNTNSPITKFGTDVVLRCFELGITVDLSHASLEVQDSVLSLCEKFGKTAIYSHSNSFSVMPHDRNITDEMFLRTLKIGGLVGLSFCCDHLAKAASIYSVLKHIDRFLELGGKHNLALGCDFDGIDILPLGISGIDGLLPLHALLVKNYGNSIANDIFFNNAFNYFTTSERR